MSNLLFYTIFSHRFLQLLLRKIWALGGRSLGKALSRHTDDYIPVMTLAPLKFVNNKPDPSILLRVTDTNNREALILLLQQIQSKIISGSATRTASPYSSPSLLCAQQTLLAVGVPRSQGCGAETIFFRSGSGSDFQKVSAPAPAPAPAPT
jgi:hypothetical protein